MWFALLNFHPFDVECCFVGKDRAWIWACFKTKEFLFQSRSRWKWPKSWAFLAFDSAAFYWLLTSTLLRVSRLIEILHRLELARALTQSIEVSTSQSVSTLIDDRLVICCVWPYVRDSAELDLSSQEHRNGWKKSRRWRRCYTIFSASYISMRCFYLEKFIFLFFFEF